MINQTLSRPGRDEVNFHLQFIKGEIELLGETSRFGRVRSRTERFFRTVVDPLYLGINDIQLDSPTVEGARVQAQNIQSELLAAYEVLRQCA